MRSGNMSIIFAWNKYIEYLKKYVTNGVKPLGFDEWIKREEGT